MVDGRIAVTVVAGGPGSGKSSLIAQLRALRPPGERWAYLGNSIAADLPGAPGAEPVVPADQRFGVAGGCACCLAGPVFRATLVRLLRAGSWHGLHIEVDPQGHPHRLTDQLRQPPFDQYLRVTQLLLTLRGDQDPERLLLPPEPLEWAGGILLRSGPAAGDAIAAQLQTAPPWPRLEYAGATASSQPALPGWRRFELAPAGGEGSLQLQRQWPAQVVFERRPLQALFARLAQQAGVAGLQATMRTPRDWYRWRIGRGSGVGPLAFEAGDRLEECETAWRLDSRLAIWFLPGGRPESVLAQLQEVAQY